MGRKKQGVSPLLGTILLVSMVFVLGVGVSIIAGRVGGPNLKETPNVLLQIWRNFPGRGAVGVVNVTGDAVREAFYADFLMDTDMGSLFENVRWKNLEVRVNGQGVENELEYVLYASPLPSSAKVKNSLLSLPSGGGLVVFSYRQGFLKTGDEVAVVHQPSRWILANATMAPPLECTEIGSAWLGQNRVDSCISLRALQLRTLEREMVSALSPTVEVRYNENYRWYKENFDKARSYIPSIENLAGQIQLLLNSC
ncbi:MAG: archaellin/type IV pilin N-terminal domain-containing protein, partial [Candidatus Hadarchaeales archaeon]